MSHLLSEGNIPGQKKNWKLYFTCVILDTAKVASINTSHLKVSTRFYRLFMEGNIVYWLWLLMFATLP